MRLALLVALLLAGCAKQAADPQAWYPLVDRDLPKGVRCLSDGREAVCWRED